MSSEAVVQQQTRLAMSNLGAQIWRNQSGALFDEHGRLIRFGLCNDSAQLNAKLKSSDLVGIVPTQAYVNGRGWTTLGVFTALEIKPTGWHLTPGDKRGNAQARFMQLVRDVGGYAGFVTDPADIYGIIGQERPR